MRLTLDFKDHWGHWSPGREVVRGIVHVFVGLFCWAVMHPFFVNFKWVWVVWISSAIFFGSSESFRLLIQKSKTSAKIAQILRWVNRSVLNKWIYRDAENRTFSASVPTVIGCGIGIACAHAFSLRWIASLSCLFLGFVDPLAKFGKRWPMGARFKNGKSWGGIVFGWLGGLVSCGVFAVACFVRSDILPGSTSLWPTIVVTCAVGVASAPFIETISGKWDNLFIILGTITTMTMTYAIFKF